MANKIKIGIVGYGQLARGVEKAIATSVDLELAVVFTRRAPESVAIGTKSAVVRHIDSIMEYKDKVDVLALCGGSATDIPAHGPLLAGFFNTVDSFDTHADIPEYYNTMSGAAKGLKVSVISVGWDPGLFSIQRLIGLAVLPNGSSHTFWGPGVSQGHSDAIRRISGVQNAIQYTVPKESAVSAARAGKSAALRVRDCHRRECYVAAKPGADEAHIENMIKSMPNYFEGYETNVNFVSSADLQKDHSKMSHGGFVIRYGRTGENAENRHLIEYSLSLESNPEFTGLVVAAYARAAARLCREGKTGALTVFDIAPSYLLPECEQEQMFNYL